MLAACCSESGLHYLMPNTSLFRDTERPRWPRLSCRKRQDARAMARAEEPNMTIG